VLALISNFVNRVHQNQEEFRKDMLMLERLSEDNQLSEETIKLVSQSIQAAQSK